MSDEQPLNHQPGSFKHPGCITICDYDDLAWETQYTSFADAIDW